MENGCYTDVLFKKVNSFKEMRLVENLKKDMDLPRIRRRNRSWWETWKKLEKVLYTIRRIQNVRDLHRLTNLDGRNHIMIVHIIKMMNENEVEAFVDKLMCFIVKWYELYAEAESDPVTKIENYFFAQDLCNFNIVFLYWEKLLHLFLIAGRSIYFSSNNCINK